MVRVVNALDIIIIITSPCILANTLLTHVTSVSSACILINVHVSPIYACHFYLQCLHYF